MLRIQDLPLVSAQAPNPVLYCPSCHSAYSANRADYCFAPPDQHLRCAHCQDTQPERIAPALQLVRFGARRVTVLAR